MSTHEFWAMLAVLAVVALVVVARLRLEENDSRVVSIERAFAFVILAGALGGAGYVLASGVSALDEAATSVSGTTSTSISTASSGSHSMATASSETTRSVDPSSSASSAAAHSIQSGNASSSTPSTQPANSKPTDLLRDLMLFVLAFATLGVLLLVGGIPWIRPSKQNRQLGDG